jgi:endo-1,4-beta-xylanase
MEADLYNPFIFQGVLHRNRVGKGYGDIPWRLGILERYKENTNEDKTDAPLYESANFPVGTSIRWSMLSNDTVMDIAGYEFNSLTAGNAMKMERVIREGFIFNFTEADAYIKYAKENNMRMFGHTLLWHNSTPDFVKELEGDKAALTKFTAKYIDTLVSRYKGRIDAWDVVNEPVLDKNGKLRDNIWFNTFGEDYFEFVFRTAYEADPTAKLFLNDYNIERDSIKLNGFLEIVNKLKKKSVPIHGIGLQMHITMDVPNEVIEKNLKKCVETGLLIHISELDIIFNKHDDSGGGGIQVYDTLTEEMLEQQAEKYKQIAEMYNRIVPYDQRYGITLWGFADRFTWIRYFFKIMDWPLIFDDNLKKKPAYFGFREGLREK